MIHSLLEDVCNTGDKHGLKKEQVNIVLNVSCKCLSKVSAVLSLFIVV
jgi:hypothetical protein